MAENQPQKMQEVELGGKVSALSAGDFVFDRYSLVQFLGRGRTSAVWKAWDNNESREIALKFLPEAIRSNTEAMAAISSSAQQAQAISIPHIARVLSLESDGSFVAVCTEMIEGTTLHALRCEKKNQVFEPPELKEWLKQITKALGDLHSSANLCHGNLYPSSFFLNSDGDITVSDTLVDATVGAWMNRLDGSAKDISRSLRYCSPQQAQEMGTIAVTDDVYSLGVAVYEMITGKPPFHTGNILAQVMEDVPPMMSRRRRDMRIVGEPIPRAWDETVAASLAKDPEKRPQSMELFANGLELFGSVKPAQNVVDAEHQAAIAAAMAATTQSAQSDQPQVSSIGGPLAPSGTRKNIIPIVAVVLGLCVGLILVWYSNQSAKLDRAVAASNPDSGAAKTNETALLNAEEVERRVQFEMEALRRKNEEESKKVAAERQRREAELEKQKADFAVAMAQAEKAKKEAELRQQQAEAEAKKRAEEAEVKKRAAEQDALRLANEREAIKKKEEELKAAVTRVSQQAEASKQAEAEAERQKLTAELVAKKAEADKLRAAAEKALQDAAATKAQADAAARMLVEQEKARKESETKALALAETERKRAQEETAKKVELEKKLQEAEKQRQLAEADQKRRLEEATRMAELERLRTAKTTDTTRRETDAKRAETEKARIENERKLLAQATMVGDRAVAGQIWHNSLGMRMVPLGELHVCAWETRKQDFETFFKSTMHNAGNGWKDPGIQQTPFHPVVSVNYDDAQAFCKWLTKKETDARIIAPGQSYRLPTDLEWSQMSLLANDRGNTPEERSDKNHDDFPWGTDWPPPPGAGNYPDAVSYDRFNATAPVASFLPNKYGIFDLGGNVWEWCQDYADAGQKQRVLRGGSWFGYVPGTLQTSHRLILAGDQRRYDNGFRVVLSK